MILPFNVNLNYYPEKKNNNINNKIKEKIAEGGKNNQQDKNFGSKRYRLCFQDSF